MREKTVSGKYLGLIPTPRGARKCQGPEVPLTSALGSKYYALMWWEPSYGSPHEN
jgi:hypothetical protein